MSSEINILQLGGLLPICELFGFTALVDKCRAVMYVRIQLSKRRIYILTNHSDEYHVPNDSTTLDRRLSEKEFTTPQSNEQSPRPLIHGVSRPPVKRVHANGNDQLKSLSRFASQGQMEEPAPKPLNLLPAAGLTTPNRSIFQPSMDDYSATAANMSELIKRGVPILTRVALPRPGELTVLNEDGRTA